MTFDPVCHGMHARRAVGGQHRRHTASPFASPCERRRARTRRRRLPSKKRYRALSRGLAFAGPSLASRRLTARLGRSFLRSFHHRSRLLSRTIWTSSMRARSFSQERIGHRTTIPIPASTVTSYPMRSRYFASFVARTAPTLFCGAKQWLIDQDTFAHVGAASSVSSGKAAAAGRRWRSVPSNVPAPPHACAPLLPPFDRIPMRSAAITAFTPPSCLYKQPTPLSTNSESRRLPARRPGCRRAAPP